MLSNLVYRGISQIYIYTYREQTESYVGATANGHGEEDIIEGQRPSQTEGRT